MSGTLECIKCLGAYPKELGNACPNCAQPAPEKFDYLPLWSEIVRNCEKPEYAQLVKHAKGLESENAALSTRLEAAKKALEHCVWTFQSEVAREALRLLREEPDPINGGKE